MDDFGQVSVWRLVARGALGALIIVVVASGIVALVMVVATILLAIGGAR